MFIGHFGAAFAAKAIAPRASLGSLFLAAQFVDLLWPVLLLLGVERVRIAPGDTAVTPLAFEHYPVSHSLLAVAAWAIALAGVHAGLRRDLRTASVLGLLVLSHWLLDAVVHRPDLPLVPGGGLLVGLGLWNSLTATLAVEGALLGMGVAIYVRCTRAADRVGSGSLVALVALLVAIEAGNLLGPAPPSVAAIAWAGHAQWLLVLWAAWVDRHRVAAPPVRVGTAPA